MKTLKAVTAKAEKDPHVLSVILFGSHAENNSTANSDIDICLVLFNKKYGSRELSLKKLEYSKEFSCDIQIFQQLPLYIRHRILKNGKILHCKDEDELYNISFRFITEYNDYKPFLKEYLQEVINA